MEKTYLSKKRFSIFRSKFGMVEKHNVTFEKGKEVQYLSGLQTDGCNEWSQTHFIMKIAMLIIYTLKKK